jgi:hypothetical protein
LTRTGGALRLPVLRPAGVPTPCYKCPKIPPDAPAKERRYAVELSEKNERVYQHYLECAAVSRFPDDPLVRRHAALIGSVLDDVERSERRQERQTLLALLQVALAR